MVGKIGTLKYIVNTFLSSAVGNFFAAGRKKWVWILLAVALVSLYTGHELTNVLPAAGKVLMRRTTAIWGISSPTKIIRFGLIEILVWEATALLGCIVAGLRLYRNTD